jgi:hypothetical protein
MRVRPRPCSAQNDPLRLSPVERREGLDAELLERGVDLIEPIAEVFNLVGVGLGGVRPRRRDRDEQGCTIEIADRPPNSDRRAHATPASVNHSGAARLLSERSGSTGVAHLGGLCVGRRPARISAQTSQQLRLQVGGTWDLDRNAEHAGTHKPVICRQSFEVDEA